MGAFEERGAVVLGVSPDGEASHVEFKAKYGCPSRSSPIPSTRHPNAHAADALAALDGP